MQIINRLFKYFFTGIIISAIHQNVYIRKLQSHVNIVSGE